MLKNLCQFNRCGSSDEKIAHGVSHGEKEGYFIKSPGRGGGVHSYNSHELPARFWARMVTLPAVGVWGMTAPAEEVRSEARRLVSILGKDGGYIASAAHAVQADTYVDNILAMVDGFKSIRSVGSC